MAVERLFGTTTRQVSWPVAAFTLIVALELVFGPMWMLLQSEGARSDQGGQPSVEAQPCPAAHAVGPNLVS